MEKIPTAEEFILSSLGDKPKLVEQWENYLSASPLADYGNVLSFMEQFAKLHVKAALKAAAENGQAFIKSNGAWVPSEAEAVIHKPSIIDAYPLENII